MIIFLPFWVLWLIAGAIFTTIALVVIKKSIGTAGPLSVPVFDASGMFIGGILLTAGLAFLGIGIYLLVIK